MTPQQLRPASTQEVAQALKAANEGRTPVIVTGGATGLADATRPNDGELVLLTDRLNRLDQIDLTAGQVTVGAGVTLAELERHAAEAGMMFPLDLGARQSATLGGMAATNAGGSLAWRFGSMRDLTAGVEVALADGSIVGSLNGLLKDNAGYGLTGLFVGSEGTLGVITALRLKLVPLMPARATALIATESLAAAVAVGVKLRGGAPDLVVCDFISQRSADLACEHRSISAPVPAPEGGWLVLAELAGSTGAKHLEEQLAAALHRMPSDGMQIALAADAAQRDAIWELRDSINSACDATGPVRKLDLSVATADLPPLTEAITTALSDAGLDTRSDIAIWGHLLDGNLHATLMAAAASTQAEDLATGCVKRFGGSVAAEHGVGRQRLQVLGLTRTEDEISAMQAIKHALDPNLILAPGRAIPGR